MYNIKLLSPNCLKQYSFWSCLTDKKLYNNNIEDDVAQTCIYEIIYENEKPNKNYRVIYNLFDYVFFNERNKYVFYNYLRSLFVKIFRYKDLCDVRPFERNKDYLSFWVESDNLISFFTILRKYLSNSNYDIKLSPHKKFKFTIIHGNQSIIFTNKQKQLLLDISYWVIQDTLSDNLDKRYTPNYLDDNFYLLSINIFTNEFYNFQKFLNDFLDSF